MIPDYSFELCFSNHHRTVTRERVVELCHNDFSDQLHDFADTSWNAEIGIIAPEDVDPAVLEGYPRLDDGRIVCAVIDFEYSPITQYVSIPECFAIQI